MPRRSPEISRISPRDVSGSAGRSGDGTVAWRGPRLGSARFQRLARRTRHGDPEGLHQRRVHVRSMDVAQWNRESRGSRPPVPAPVPGLARARASWPGRRSPARRPRCVATSPGWSGWVVSLRTRRARCVPRRGEDACPESSPRARWPSSSTSRRRRCGTGATGPCSSCSTRRGCASRSSADSTVATSTWRAGR